MSREKRHTTRSKIGLVVVPKAMRTSCSLVNCAKSTLPALPFFLLLSVSPPSTILITLSGLCDVGLASASALRSNCQSPTEPERRSARTSEVLALAFLGLLNST
jgi:hypothetical protein